jgi:hypothetical protein
LGVAYVRAILSGSGLWMCTSSAELEIHLNGRVLSIGHVMVWSSHVEYVAWCFEFLVMHMVIMVN